MKADSNIAAGLHYYVLQSDTGMNQPRLPAPTASSVCSSTVFWVRLASYLLCCQMMSCGHVSFATAVWQALSNPGQRVNVVTTPVASGGTDYLSGEAAKAHPCRLLSSVEDTLFTTAKDFGNDWLSVWSMNPGNPDHRRTLTPRYYAHPLEVTSGETAEQIMRRFGISEAELVRANPTVMDLHSLQVGDTLCVVPNFWQTMGGNGAKICFI